MPREEKIDPSTLDGDLAKQIAVLRQDIADLTATFGDYSKAQAGQVHAAAVNKAADLAKVGTQAAQSAKATAEVAYSDAEDAIRANPATAVGIAAGLGFLVGLMTSRR